MSEVLTKKDFDKVLPIIELLEEKGCIIPKEAEDVCDKSSATIRRYLGLLIQCKKYMDEDIEIVPRVGA